MAARKSTPPAEQVVEPPAETVIEQDLEQDVTEEQESAAEEQAEAEAEAGPTAVEVTYVEALRRERADYLRYGRKDRAAAVADELKRLGAPLERAVPAPKETA